MTRSGTYFGDTGGGSWGIQFESGATYESFGYKDPLAEFARENNVPRWNGQYAFNLREGVDWTRRLRVVDPCEARGAC